MLVCCSVLGVPSEESLMLWMLLITNVLQRNFPTVSGQRSANDGIGTRVCSDVLKYSTGII